MLTCNKCGRGIDGEQYCGHCMADICAERSGLNYRLVALEEECERLSACACEHVIGDEFGNPTCKTREAQLAAHILADGIGEAAEQRDEIAVALEVSESKLVALRWENERLRMISVAACEVCSHVDGCDGLAVCSGFELAPPCSRADDAGLEDTKRLDWLLSFASVEDVGDEHFVPGVVFRIGDAESQLLGNSLEWTPRQFIDAAINEKGRSA